MTLALMVFAVEKNILPTLTKQPSKTWTCQLSSRGSSTLNDDWMTKRLNENETIFITQTCRMNAIIFYISFFI